MQFDNYISDLLYRYDCVIVPDLGAFLSHTVSAEIDTQSNTFYPPKKVLSFNAQLTTGDGLLANYIANVEKIPFEAANKKISKKVNSLKSFLAQGEILNFENIGDLFLADHGKITFEPSHKLNYLTNAFGLTEFSSPYITREALKEEAETIEKAIPLTVTPEKRKTRPYLKYAAIAIIALGLSGFFATNYYNTTIEQHNEMAEGQAQEELNSKIQEATFVIPNPLPALTLKVEKQVGNYHIVAGAFRFEENCDKKLNELIDLGFKARKIGVNKYGLHQVVYSSYETRLEAQRELYKIRRQHNKDAWLLIQDLDK